MLWSDRSVPNVTVYNVHRALRVRDMRPGDIYQITDRRDGMAYTAADANGNVKERHCSPNDPRWQVYNVSRASGRQRNAESAETARARPRALWAESEAAALADLAPGLRVTVSTISEQVIITHPNGGQQVVGIADVHRRKDPARMPALSLPGLKMALAGEFDPATLKAGETRHSTLITKAEASAEWSRRLRVAMAERAKAVVADQPGSDPNLPEDWWPEDPDGGRGADAMFERAVERCQLEWKAAKDERPRGHRPAHPKDGGTSLAANLLAAEPVLDVDGNQVDEERAARARAELRAHQEMLDARRQEPV